MTQQAVQPWWPPLSPEQREEVVERSAKHMIEARRKAWTFMLKQTLGFWELPPRQQLTVMLDGIARMQQQLATNPELAQYGPVRADVAFFEALRAIEGEEANRWIKRYVELLTEYGKEGAPA